ncbi:MAG: hypothetical protein AMXMBFR84_27190 [Candidatus Hydrogenedentota bacterium]
MENLFDLYTFSTVFYEIGSSAPFVLDNYPFFKRLVPTFFGSYSQGVGIYF